MLQVQVLLQDRRVVEEFSLSCPEGMAMMVKIYPHQAHRATQGMVVVVVVVVVGPVLMFFLSHFLWLVVITIPQCVMRSEGVVVVEVLLTLVLCDKFVVELLGG